MNSKKNDVFSLTRPQLCQYHNKKLQLVCSDPGCEDHGLICIDCLVQNHQDCKGYIKKYDEFLQSLYKEIERVQCIKEKRFQDAQSILLSLGKLQQKFNDIILTLQLNIETFLQEFNQEDDNQIMIKKLFQPNFEGENESIKNIIQNLGKLSFKEQEFPWVSQGIQIVEDLSKILQGMKNLEFVEQKQPIVSSKYQKVKGIDDLKGITNNIPKLRIVLQENNWAGIRNTFPKFVALNNLQITAVKSPLKAQVLEEIISAMQYLPRLEKVKINLIGSNANDSTLRLILKIITSKSLSEFGISFGYSQILSDEFIRQINQFKEQLKGIQKIYISNQLHEFTEKQQKLLKSYISQIEFIM
ncbi:unnamed protein product (macronuclear) [Paramecium tetraurelia]|uniref:B box-type domain-containing protein n=1 Tax=Paramecium tetraurelia TaxID=5888 RepID=A0EB58_PARTE|nr:uncharacterized protein GSPATT00025259001 [Paramecium tetraurelia]CAK92525.1 unnamed protein product [Paramecium tetraurelia]|eukprot:XP_001459922.1 hypothetical protein (macronuclear) [Paramecium tetraurelia strain d4-2]